MKLGDKIRQLRIENNLTQKKFGELFNVAKNTISQYENSVSTPDVEMQKKICNKFNVSLDWLNGRTNIREPYGYVREDNTQYTSDTHNSTNFYKDLPSELDKETMQNITAAIKDNPELLDFWDQLVQREDLQLMFKQTKRLTPESIRKIIEVIKLIEDEEKKES